MAREFTRTVSMQYANATQGRKGQPIKQTSSTACDLASNIADVPFGVLLNEPKQNEWATVLLISPGEIFKGLAGETLVALDKVCIRGSGIATGKFAKVAGTFPKATYDTGEKYLWGVVLVGCSTDQLAEIRGFPQFASLTDTN